MRPLSWTSGCALLVAWAAASPAPASAGPVEKGAFGLGIIIGEPTGLSARVYLRDDQALQGAIALSPVVGGLQLQADYVFHPIILEEREAFTLPAYVGPGLAILQHPEEGDADGDVRLGLRVVAGIVFDFKELPLDAFAEVAAVAQYRFGSESESVNGFGLGLNAGIGGRYYF